MAYWREEEHKEKKRALNGKRKAARISGGPASAVRPPAAATQIGPVHPKATLLEYVRIVISLIEGRKVSRRQVLQMLQRVVRQHRMVRHRKIDQALRQLNKEPP